MNVKETINYDNYLNKPLQDDYKATLEGHTDIKVGLPQKIKSKEEKAGVYKILIVHFRNVDDMAQYCSIIGQCIDYKTKIAYFPKIDPETSLFDEEEPTPSQLRPSSTQTNNPPKEPE